MRKSGLVALFLGGLACALALPARATVFDLGTFNIGLSAGQITATVDPQGNPGFNWTTPILAFAPTNVGTGDVVRATLAFTGGDRLQLADNGGGFFHTAAGSPNRERLTVSLQGGVGASLGVVAATTASFDFANVAGTLLADPAVNAITSSGSVILNATVNGIDLTPAGNAFSFDQVTVEVSLDSLSIPVTLERFAILMSAQDIQIVQDFAPVPAPGGGAALLALAAFGSMARRRRATS
jgi:predicted aconitase with swiveling domain